MKNMIIILQMNDLYAFYEDKKNNYIKVKYYCHYTGKYRGAAH